MDKPQKPAKAPQLDPELEKYRKYDPFVLGMLPPSEFRAILKYIWSGKPQPQPPPESPEK